MSSFRIGSRGCGTPSNIFSHLSPSAKKSRVWPVPTSVTVYGMSGIAPVPHGGDGGSVEACRHVVHSRSPAWSLIPCSLASMSHSLRASSVRSILCRSVRILRQMVAAACDRKGAQVGAQLVHGCAVSGLPFYGSLAFLTLLGPLFVPWVASGLLA